MFWLDMKCFVLLIVCLLQWKMFVVSIVLVWLFLMLLVRCCSELMLFDVIIGIGIVFDMLCVSVRLKFDFVLLWFMFVSRILLVLSLVILCVYLIVLRFVFLWLLCVNIFQCGVLLLVDMCFVLIVMMMYCELYLLVVLCMSCGFVIVDEFMLILFVFVFSRCCMFLMVCMLLLMVSGMNICDVMVLMIGRIRLCWLDVVVMLRKVSLLVFWLLQWWVILMGLLVLCSLMKLMFLMICLVVMFRQGMMCLVRVMMLC